MTRILLVETAFPQRVRMRAEAILSGRVYPSPELTILCSDDLRTAHYLGEIAGAEVIPLWEHEKKRILSDLKLRTFDVMNVFWTGEKKYRRMKRTALRIPAGIVEVDIGDGSRFRLTWKAFIRHSLFRLLHPLPTDHWQFVAPEPEREPPYNGERVLIVQSADPQHVLAALTSLHRQPLFRVARYSLFCRNRPEIVRQFEGHPMLYQVITHSESRGSVRHLLALRRERFDAVIVFLTGDPSYWKVKCFAFLLGARNKLIYNENNDCFYFSARRWLSFVGHRLGERAEAGRQPRWTQQLRILLSLTVKLLAFPFRFAWLLLVWLRLRSAGLKDSS